MTYSIVNILRKQRNILHIDVNTVDVLSITVTTLNGKRKGKDKHAKSQTRKSVVLPYGYCTLLCKPPPQRNPSL